MKGWDKRKSKLKLEKYKYLFICFSTLVGCDQYRVKQDLAEESDSKVNYVFYRICEQDILLKNIEVYNEKSLKESIIDIVLKQDPSLDYEINLHIGTLLKLGYPIDSLIEEYKYAYQRYKDEKSDYQRFGNIFISAANYKDQELDYYIGGPTADFFSEVNVSDSVKYITLQYDVNYNPVLKSYQYTCDQCNEQTIQIIKEYEGK